MRLGGTDRLHTARVTRNPYPARGLGQDDSAPDWEAVQ
jgi:hypothetical protein